MNPRPSLPLASLLFSLLLFHFPAASIAAEKEAAGVQLKIGAILASNEGDYFDPKLSRFKNQLEGIKYRSYRLLKEETQNARWKDKAAFQIPGSRSLLITPQEYSGERILLEVQLVEGKTPFLDTKIRLRNGGNILVGGPPHEKGVLVILISASVQ